MKIRENYLPYALPYYGEEEINQLVDTVKSNWWSKGPKTVKFEEKFAEYVGASYAVAFNSCTAALHALHVAKGIGKGDEVITTPMTFCATANTVIHTGATPVFVDISEETGLIDADLIEAAITSKTKAIVPVHYAGQAADMDKIIKIANKYNLYILEDAAHAVCTTYKGKTVGSISDATAFSFYATKNLATGEGGMLTTNDKELAEKLRIVSLHGMNKNAWNRYGKGGSWKYDVVEPGYKYNMTDFQAALGLCQLERLEKMQQTREKYAQIYNQAFSELEGIELLKQLDTGKSAHHLYIIKVKNERLNITRDEFIEKLTEMNIGTAVHFIPVHLHPYYIENLGTKPGDFPVCERFYSEIISIPLFPAMKEEDVYYVAEAVRKIARDYAK